MVTQKKPLQTIQKIKKPRRKRPGVHAKTRASKCKQSKNYLKRSRGQNT